MGNFISSPYQRASENLYDMAVNGQVVGDKYLQGALSNEQRSLRTQASNVSGGIAGDIMSRMASQGFAPSGAAENVIGAQKQKLYGQEQAAELQLDAATQQNMANLLINQLTTGLQGLSHSSPLGDILGGLTSIVNIGSGIATMGGKGGFGWWGGGGNSGGTGTTAWNYKTNPDNNG